MIDDGGIKAGKEEIEKGESVVKYGKRKLNPSQKNLTSGSSMLLS